MTILYILIAVLMFGALIAIHEFGHFIAAKSLGVRVNEFAIGMGPKLLSRERGETVYSLRAFPIGGFCAMEGEGEDSDDPRAFGSKPAWKRLIILAAGAFFNFVAGVLVILFLFAQTEGIVAPVVRGYMSGAEDLQAAGLLPGDRIYRVDGHRIYFNSDALLYLSRAGDVVDLEVERNGERVALDAFSIPVRTLVDENGNTVQKRGIYIGVAEEVGLAGRLQYAWYQAVDYVRMVWLSLGDLLTGAVGVRDMSGPIGIVDMMGEMGQAGARAGGFAGAARNILEFVSFIAINLAVMNLLPIPALDGGRIFFLAVDGVSMLLFRRKVPEKYQAAVNAACFVALMGVMVLVTLKDVGMLFGAF